ncbi:hypothetical protein CR513_17311, partial [Mucuna pruriens]
MDKSIRWYPKWNKREEVVYQCGNFPNVSLMGTQGCINYNSSVTLKQSGYPMLHPPNEESIAPLIIHGLKSPNESVGRRGCNLGPRSHGTSTSYKNWLRIRVGLIKLSFNGPLSTTSDSLIPDPSKDKEVEELPESLVKMENEKENLKRKLKEAYEGQRIAWDEASKERRGGRKQNENKRMFEDRSQEIIFELKVEITTWKGQFSNLADQAKQHPKSMENDNIFWEDRYRKIAWLVNQAIADVLRAFREAEGMTNPLETPVEISSFLNYCNDLL